MFILYSLLHIANHQNIVRTRIDIKYKVNTNKANQTKTERSSRPPQERWLAAGSDALSNLPFVSTVEARDKQRHRFVRRTRLELLVNALALLALAALELVRHGLWFLLEHVHVTLHLGIQNGRPPLWKHVLRLHKRNVMRRKLLFLEALDQTLIVHIGSRIQVGQDRTRLVLVQDDEPRMPPILWHF